MESAGITTWQLTLLLVLVRLGGIFAVGPVFSHSAVPWKLRLFMMMAVGVAVTARVAPPQALGDTWGDLLAAVGGEALIGLAIGWAAGLVFVGVELGAYHVAAQMGLSLGEMFDPVSPSAPGTMRQFFCLLAIIVFLGVGGHRAMISAVFKTFGAVPLAGSVPAVGVFETMISLVAVSFAMALKVAAPVLVALLLAAVAMGLLQRSLPQCHILSVALPVRAVLTLVVLAGALTIFAGLVESGTTMVLEAIAPAVGPG